ncbi:tyrosyl-DNA phosphodiesterase 2 [Microcaecilia unicolor]|uniref:Tyrosyl-DNA phosphodiesterase 2 n=1 Tax=Microcaecilia unicolor TaxID=1415580 RepID=A0A6P7WWJ3_9AMPH|nr:tyrosyl-DNA phosphodiesterase 2 [Microcaecilia unicolor]
MPTISTRTNRVGAYRDIIVGPATATFQPKEEPHRLAGRNRRFASSQLRRALNSFFESPVQSVSSQHSLLAGMDTVMSTSETCIDLTDDSVAVDCLSATSSTTGNVQHEDDSTFSFLTWNIDGLDLANLQERARGVCSYLALYAPDVVFLQELIVPYYNYLKKRAVTYTIIPGGEDGYFTGIMLKTSRVKLLSQEIIPFKTTSMMRNLLIVQVNISGNNVCLMTSHLESTKEHSKERLNQLKLLLEKMQTAPESTTVIFAGDTNLRDQEVTKIGGLPLNILDVWEFLDKPEHCRYTWDTKMNSNLRAPYTCRLRFDRVLYRAAASGGQMIPRALDLIGLEKLDCGRFPSDHWGLLCSFDVIL